jgi:AMMECR1 domain-containing protein
LIRYVVAAALRDPRFEPVRLEEVPSLSIKVQLLEPPEAITRISDLDPAIYGIIVRANGRHALLLPDIERITTAEEQVRAACDKAGIGRYAALRIERFRTRNLE